MAEKMRFDLDAEELEVFSQESDELLGQLDADLLALEQGDRSSAVIQRLFRAAHTLKGSSGSIGHQRMANLTHSMETLLELLRQSQISVTPPLIDLLLESVDGLRLLNQEVNTQTHSGFEPDALVAKLRSFVSKGASPAPAGALEAIPSSMPTEPVVAEHQPEAGRLSQPEALHVLVSIDKASIAPAARILQVLMALDECGVVLWSKPDRAAVEQGEPMSQLEAVVASMETAEAVTDLLSRRVGEMTHVHVSLQGETVEEPTSEAGEKDGTAGEPEAAVAEAGAGKAAAAGAGKASSANMKTVRTSVERLDKLMNLVGELVTDRNRLLQTHSALTAQYGDAEFLSDLAQAISHMATITDELQEEVMRARMLPLENVFNKFPRMVRDLAHDAGKQVSLVIEGQETELDRSVIEEIADPLMHLLRNAVDHGVEAPEDRRNSGKPETGTIRLAGRSEGNQIIITVSDDGPGIDLSRVRKAAISKGLITEEAASRLTEIEACDLIFLPGLSTAKKVTDVSGRGVGMDVVRTNIERLHGSVNVRSQYGIGTTFELSLPLTLAIMPVLRIGLCGGVFCIPLTAVVEVLEISPKEIHMVEKGEIVQWRGRLLPLLRLRNFFNFTGQVTENSGRYPVVAVRSGEEHIGLIVDYLLGQQEIVIKNMGRLVGQVPGISGSTILGDGSVALIIDVPGLSKRAATRSTAEQIGRSA